MILDASAYILRYDFDSQPGAFNTFAQTPPTNLDDLRRERPALGLLRVRSGPVDVPVGPSQRPAQHKGRRSRSRKTKAFSASLFPMLRSASDRPGHR